MARVLSSRGHDVVVFTTKGNVGRDEGYQVCDQLRGVWWHDRNVVGDLNGFDILHVVNSAWNWMVRFGKPTFVSIHGNDFISPNSVFGLGVKDFFKLPRGDRVDFWLAGKLTPKLMRKAFPKCSRIFANSEFTRQEFLRRFPCCPENVITAGVGVNPTFLSIGKESHHKTIDGTARLLTVCRLSERRKNVDLVLQALSRLKPEFLFHYTVVGDGTLRSDLERLTYELGLNERVTFAGRASNEELVSHYRNADLLVLPSGISEHSFEGFGIVYLEANAFGVPSMAVRVGGAQEAVDEGRSGFFIEAPTVNLICDGLRGFLEDNRQFSPDDCRSFASQFTWERVVDLFENNYHEALSGDI